MIDIEALKPLIVEHLKSHHPLKKSYHRYFHALNDVNFEIKKGVS